MNPDTFIDFFTANNLQSIGLKLFGIVGAFIFLIFSLVIVKQIQVMRKTVVFSGANVLTWLALLQFLLSLALVFYSLFVL